MAFSEGYLQRFSGIGRLYGEAALARFASAHVCVIGIGGVGSWVAESLVRSGIGEITLIDLDDICVSNTNRQLHTLSSVVGEMKTVVMAERLQQINPECRIHIIDDFIDADNMATYLGTKEAPQYDWIVDAIDSLQEKAALLAYCKRQKLKCVTIGGAGGQIDPTQIKIADLAKTVQDPLLAKLRERLKSIHHLHRDSKGKFGLPAVYSTEQLRYPAAQGTICFSKSALSDSDRAQHQLRMDCSSGLGAISTVTATFGLVAVSYLLKRLADIT